MASRPRTAPSGRPMIKNSGESPNDSMSPNERERSHTMTASPSLVSIMVEEKLNRKKAEKDLQALASRITLLRTEEQKALSKISETRARAQEILSMKKRKEDIVQKQLGKSMVRELHVKTAQERAQKEREARQSKLASSKKVFHDSKKAVVEQQKELAQRLHEQINNSRLHIDEEKRLKVDEERLKREQARLKREKERQEREAKIQAEYQSKIAEEARRRKEAESLIDLLEKEERDLIVRLKRTQELQNSALSVLAKSIEA